MTPLPHPVSTTPDPGSCADAVSTSGKTSSLGTAISLRYASITSSMSSLAAVYASYRSSMS
eukprot:843512-Pyramimonas_sp.AAC.1